MVLEALQKLIGERIDKDPSEITPDVKLADLGIDSLDTVEMLMDLSDELGQEIDLTEKVETVGELVEVIESKLN